MIAKAQGVWLETVDGVKYLDMISGYGALNQGHCHPRIVEALRHQGGRAALLSDALYNDQQGRLYERLSALTRKDLVFLANSGVEAIEAALKVARRWGYRAKGVPKDCAEIIVSEGNFHGRTITAVSFSTDPSVRADFGPYTPGFKSVPFGDLEALERAITPNTVAFLTEPIQGRGIRVPPPGFLRDARDLCRRNRVLFLADEVQTGFGRTGKRFCCDWEGMDPDVYILGKALGGGIYPVSAISADAEALGVLEPGSHGTTYGANALACAVALAALDVVEEEALAERALELGGYFTDRLRELNSPLVKDVRGRGLFLGLELTRPVEPYCEELRKRGILCKGMGSNTVRLVPPLVITKEELDWAMERLQDALREER
jgi:ornithine--oxo-acid transaminase